MYAEKDRSQKISNNVKTASSPIQMNTKPLLDDVRVSYNMRSFPNHSPVIQYCRFCGRISDTSSPNGRFDRNSPTQGVPGQFTSSDTITHKSRKNIGPRPNLSQIMGGSASQRSQITNAEYMHRQGRQLNGPDTPSNLIPGYHATNSAMIPAENLARGLSNGGNTINYTVTTPPRVGPLIWADRAEITMDITGTDNNGQQIHQTVQFNVEADSSERLNSTSYSSINQAVQQIRHSLQASGFRTSRR